jgi:hypothetical protein
MFERRRCFGQIGFARRRQPYGAARAMKQPRPEMTLRLLDMPRERGRRHVQFLGRAREMQMSRHAQKRPQMTQFDTAHD